jgi:chemotaxis protein methyltransferase CheR
MRRRPENVGVDPMSLSRLRMSDAEFSKYSRFIEGELGIKMPAAKKVMLEARLMKRLKVLGLESFSDYYRYVFAEESDGSELICLIDAVTTNKTDFFREPSHFDYLTRTVVPELSDATGAGRQRPLAVWSAGCSTGEEPYTIAMVLSELAKEISWLRFSILGTDISSRVLEAARTATYEEARSAPIPMPLRHAYLLKSKDPGKGLIRIAREIRDSVEFRRLNLMEDSYGLEGSMDVIFCRNVIIYFDRPTQERLVRKLARCLREGGFLFMGHSETLLGMSLPLRTAAPTVYRKTPDE